MFFRALSLLHQLFTSALVKLFFASGSQIFKLVISFTIDSFTETVSKVLLGDKNSENRLVLLRISERQKSLSKSSFILPLWFIRRLFKPEFQLALCQFLNLFSTHTDPGNILRREIDIPSWFAMLFWIFSARATFRVTSSFFLELLITLFHRCWFITKRRLVLSFFPMRRV